MIDYKKLNWISSSMSDEHGFTDGYYTVSHYTIKDFPEINIYIDDCNQIIIDTFLDGKE